MPRDRTRPLVDALAARIRSGALRPGDRLPTVRALMRSEGIALATAARVYEELAAIGLVVGETGRGTFVRDASLPRGTGLEQHPLGRGVLDLGFNYPALPGQAELLREGLRGLAAAGDLDALLHSAPQGGRPHERHMVARHLRNRGIRVPGEQVLIVNGAQHGLAVTAMALLQPGDAVAVDALTYPGMKALAAAHRLELVPIAQAAGRMDLDALAARFRRRRVRAVYTMPTLHNPLGTVMGEADRLRLAALAERHDVLLIEDAAYAFLAEPAPPPLFALAPDRTVYVSGFSKSVASGLRVGFLAAPNALLPALEQAIRVSTWNTSSVAIALLCRWIDAGVVDDLEDAKRRDAQRRQRLARRVLKELPYLAHPSGYYLWLPMPEDVRADSVAVRLRDEGILVSTAESYAATRQVPHALRIALGSLPADALQAGLRALRAAVAG